VGKHQAVHWRRPGELNAQLLVAHPADVKQACKVLASDAFQYKDTRMGVAGADQFGTVIRVKDSGIACVLLKEYVRGRVRQA